MSGTQAAPRTRSWLRILFPMFILALIAAMFVIPFVWQLAGLEIETAMPILMPLYPLCLLLLGVWWLFFSGFSWTAKFAGIALALVLAGSASAATFVWVRKIELTTGPTGLRPIFHFTWEPSPQDDFADFLANSAKPDAAADIDVDADDFPAYRGRNRDGIIKHLELYKEWAASPPIENWKHPLVEGYSGIAVAGNLVVTLEQRGKKEVVSCYDRKTGAERWAYAYDAYREDVMGIGPRSTPTIHKGLIFTLGATGECVCLNAEGKKQWQINVLEDSKAKNIKWGMTGSPLIVDDLVVVHAGIDPDNPAGAALVAYEQATGKKRWAIGNRKAGYSSPQLVTLGNVRQILLFDGDGLVSYDPKTQKELWQTPWVTDWEMNSIQPVILGNDRVFISSELDNGCALYRVTPPKNGSTSWSVAEVWRNKNLASRFANPVSDGKRIFGLHGIAGQLRCLDAESGALLWRGDRVGPGQMLLVNDVLLVVHEREFVTLMDKDAAEPTELARHAMLDPRWKTWNTPALAGNQLFLRNQRQIGCWTLPQR